MGTDSAQSQIETIRILLVDDSVPFRRLFRDIVADDKDIEIVDEAGNGIEALEKILKHKPNVIVMDLEMPLMDGLTALQHLMIHVPTPTIIVSGLTEEGTARAFDSLKNGAVDFVYKGSFLENNSIITNRDRVIQKIKQANKVTVSPMEPAGPKDQNFLKTIGRQNSVGFCEECGHRIKVDSYSQNHHDKIVCPNCGETSDLGIGQKYRRVNFIVTLGAGKGTYPNILKIIPQINPAINGSIILSMYEDRDHIHHFTRYLDSISLMSVVEYKEGISLSSGTCYVASVSDNIAMSSHLTEYTLRPSDCPVSEEFSHIDLFMKSVSEVFKTRVMGIVISGSELDGAAGLDIIRKNGGTVCLLAPERCLYQEMAKHIVKKIDADLVDDEKQLSQKIENAFKDAGRSIVTA